VGSCKRQICALGAELLPGQFIGGHPMAGRETTGIQNGTSLLFAEKRYILCPDARTPAEALDKLETLVKAIGSTVKHLDPDTHDRIMAYVSHFPQLYATLLSGVLKQNKPTQLMQYQGAGLDDQMRLAGSSYPMWKDVFELNADNLAEVLRQFVERATLAQAVLSQNPPKEGDAGSPDVSLASLFSDANEMYRTWIDFKQNPIVARK
jgi:prephenate dehydrogenase